MENEQDLCDLNDVKELITCEGLVEAEVIKAKLKSFGIPCALRFFESIGRIYGITTNGLGKIKIVVPSDRLQQALEILKSDDHVEDNEQLD